LVFVAASAACSSSHPSTSAPPADAAAVDAPAASGDAPLPPPDAPSAPPDGAAIIAARPYTLHVPTGLDAGAGPAPLVVMFHGSGTNAASEELLLDLSAESDAAAFLYAYGEGTTDSMGDDFWNATDACCDLYHSGVDDVAYFDAIVADVSAKYAVDRKRIFVFGHSNGGFMAHRLACDRASTVAAIISLEGATYLDASKCNPSEHVSVVEIHGDADQTVMYGGGMTMEGTYPSATGTVAEWAQKDGCTGSLAATGTTYTLENGLPANNATVMAYAGCPSGVDVQLWSVAGGTHIPPLNHAVFLPAVWSFFSAHPKP
jgi:polyhydroxybutyrate depolymerase